MMPPRKNHQTRKGEKEMVPPMETRRYAEVGVKLDVLRVQQDRTWEKGGHEVVLYEKTTHKPISTKDRGIYDANGKVRGIQET
jgi:hypothetical protein